MECLTLLIQHHHRFQCTTLLCNAAKYTNITHYHTYSVHYPTDSTSILIQSTILLFQYPVTQFNKLISFHFLRLAKKWTDSKVKIGSEMNIDAPYEFANFVKSEGVKLTPDPAFCVKDEDHCAILHSPPSSCVS